MSSWAINSPGVIIAGCSLLIRQWFSLQGQIIPGNDKRVAVMEISPLFGPQHPFLCRYQAEKCALCGVIHYIERWTPCFLTHLDPFSPGSGLIRMAREPCLKKERKKETAGQRNMELLWPAVKGLFLGAGLNFPMAPSPGCLSVYQDSSVGSHDYKLEPLLWGSTSPSVTPAAA